MEDLHARSHGESFLDFIQRADQPGLYIMDEPDADIFSFDEGSIQQIQYEDTESYQITKMFLDHRTL